MPCNLPSPFDWNVSGKLALCMVISVPMWLSVVLALEHRFIPHSGAASWWSHSKQPKTSSSAAAATAGVSFPQYGAVHPNGNGGSGGRRGVPGSSSIAEDDDVKAERKRIRHQLQLGTTSPVLFSVAREEEEGLGGGLDLSNGVTAMGLRKVR